MTTHNGKKYIFLLVEVYLQILRYKNGSYVLIFKVTLNPTVNLWGKEYMLVS